MRKTNRLLDALPRDVFARLERQCETLALTNGRVLHKAGEVIRELYFPLDCMISITVTMQSGKTAETGVIGNREVAGINAFMGGRETTQTEYEVQIPGTAVRMPAAELKREFDHNRDVRDVLLKYTQAMLAQISQNTACNRLHTAEQRYARWLLEVRDRIQSEQLQLTQEFAGDMLGVRRASVNKVSRTLEKRNLITQRRGLTDIIDGRGLEAVSCECYLVVKEEYGRLLGVPNGGAPPH
ncbi:MAG TPA: Crp/Fnr family transcriptional regulator [Thermoanaerobaculia bacterium]|nr:Crp/Fnr family transcriptional regulator [Thermoanaerobaculia bacterium]